ncbi:hypothetical protein C8Q78DRAFT_195323 [Trametes maxima]|nr:hypothetical protein C8Q78DRAFT_195323 [Trametes maxima]
MSLSRQEGSYFCRDRSGSRPVSCVCHDDRRRGSRMHLTGVSKGFRRSVVGAGPCRLLAALQGLSEVRMKGVYMGLQFVDDGLLLMFYSFYGCGDTARVTAPIDCRLHVPAYPACKVCCLCHRTKLLDVPWEISLTCLDCALRSSHLTVELPPRGIGWYTRNSRADSVTPPERMGLLSFGIVKTQMRSHLASSVRCSRSWNQLLKSAPQYLRWQLTSTTLPKNPPAPHFSSVPSKQLHRCSFTSHTKRYIHPWKRPSARHTTPRQFLRHRCAMSLKGRGEVCTIHFRLSPHLVSGRKMPGEVSHGICGTQDHV